MNFKLYLTIYRELASFKPSVESETFTELLRIANENKINIYPQYSERYIEIRSTLENKGLALILEVLNKYQCRPNFSGQGEGFHVRIVRSYTKKEAVVAPFLYLPNLIHDGNICHYSATDGEHWVGMVDTVGEFSGEGWKQNYGTMGEHNHFVSDEIKSELEQMNLKGLVFRRLLWDHPEQAKRHYWEITSNITLPPCLQKTYTVDKGTMIEIEDQCFEPVEICYDQNSLSDFGEFDFALTYEKIGFLENESFSNRRMVISHKAREAFESVGIKIGYSLGGYGMVRLGRELYDFQSFFPNIEIT